MLSIPTKRDTLREINDECPGCLGVFFAEDYRGILRQDVCVCCFDDAKRRGYVPQLLHVDTCMECWERE